MGTASLVGDSRRSERRHVREGRDGRPDQAQGKSRAGAFAETHAEIEQRLMANDLKQGGVPGFGRAMRCEETSGRGRTDTCGKRRGSGCNESVCDDGNPAGRRSETKAAHGGNFEASDAAKNAERI